MRGLRSLSYMCRARSGVLIPPDAGKFSPKPFRRQWTVGAQPSVPDPERQARFSALTRHLQVVEGSVQALGLDELFMSTTLDDVPSLQDQDLARRANGTQAMGNHD